MLYYPHRRRHVFRYLFSAIKFEEKNHQRILSGGIIPLVFYVLSAKHAIFHFVVLRSYMLFIALFLKFGNRDTVITLHDTLFLRAKKFTLRYLIQWVLFLCSEHIFVYNRLDKKIVTKYKAISKTHIVRNGIATVNKRNKEAIVSKTILFAGGLGLAHKGLSFLEAALLNVKREYQLLVCGQHAKKAVHKNFVGELTRDEFHQLMTSARMVVVSSEYDSFSLVALEALSLGVPIIITENCGIADYLESSIDCLKVNYGDVTSLSQRIEQLLSDDALWETLSRNGQSKAQEFLWDKIVFEYMDYYDMVMEEQHIQS